MATATAMARSSGRETAHVRSPCSKTTFGYLNRKRNSCSPKTAILPGRPPGRAAVTLFSRDDIPLCSEVPLEAGSHLHIAEQRGFISIPAQRRARVHHRDRERRRAPEWSRPPQG